MPDASQDLVDEIAGCIRAADIGGMGSTVDADEAAESIAAFLFTDAGWRLLEAAYGSSVLDGKRRQS